MSPEQLTCPKCSGHMDLGFVADKAHHSMPDVPTWVEGAPERSFWTGLKTKNRDVFVVVTYRCERCGYLESFATTPPS